MFSELVTAGVKRRVERKPLRHLEDSQVAYRVGERVHNRIIYAVENKMGWTGSEVFGGNEIMRSDRSPEIIAELPLVLPAAPGERARRLRRVGRRIAAPEQEHPARGAFEGPKSDCDQQGAEPTRKEERFTNDHQ
jgi:hypothetical protein